MLKSIGYGLSILFACCIVGLLTSGCYHVPRRTFLGVGGTGVPSREQVSTCQRELGVRNWSGVLSVAFGGAAGGATGVAADLAAHPQAQTGVEIGAASAAGLALAMTLTNLIEGNSMGANHCDQVLAPDTVRLP